MAAKPEEITATFIRETVRRDDWMAGLVWFEGNQLAIAGNADPDEFQAEQDYRLKGVHSTFRGKPQFKFDSFVLQQPHSRTGVVAYLRAAGEGHNFGPARAAKCWEKYGSDAVRMCREESARVADDLSAVPRLMITYEQMAAIAANLERDKALEACTLDLNELLNNRGFRKTLPKMLIRDLGNQAAQKIKNDPFLLIEGKYPGCGFKNVDRMYMSLKLPPHWLKRQAYAAWHAIASNRDGHTWMERTIAEAGIRNHIGGTDLRIADAMELAFELGMLREIRTRGKNGPIDENGSYQWVAVADAADREEELAEMIVDAMEEDFEWPDVSEVEGIDGEQPEILEKALRGPIAILGGKPGCGKTHVAGKLVKVLLKRVGYGNVGIGTPTNLAAQRLSDAMVEINIRARTWHSMLGRPVVRGKEWKHDKDNPFPYKIIVGDEGSMNDLRIAHAVFAARGRGTMLLWLGDIGQLPPVDRGAPFRDLIDAGLPYGELTEIRRNDGGIVAACKAIAEGKPWVPGGNLQLIEVDDEAKQLKAVITTLAECEAAGFDPVWDSRIIVARNETRRNFNKALQVVLNKNPGINGSPFRIGDKVINRDSKDFKIVQADLDNEDCEYNDRGEVRVANGEVGEVLEVHDGHFIIKVLTPDRVVKVPRGKVSEVSEADDDGKDVDKTGTGCSWDLAYAITFHSSQGSQFPYAIIVANSRDGHMGSRELVYTGISRAQVKAVLVGMKSTFDKFCRRVALKQRKTLLKERILLKQAERVLVDL